MKQLMVLMMLALVSVKANALNVLVPVESKTGNKYYLQIMVPGAKAGEETAITKVIKQVVPEITKGYSITWLMDHRTVIMDRLEKEFKTAKLYCDGIGVLRLRMQGDKILDVE